MALVFCVDEKDTAAKLMIRPRQAHTITTRWTRAGNRLHFIRDRGNFSRKKRDLSAPRLDILGMCCYDIDSNNEKLPECGFLKIRKLA